MRKIYLLVLETPSVRIRKSLTVPVPFFQGKAWRRVKGALTLLGEGAGNSRKVIVHVLLLRR